jgi:hypothetical protein
MQHMPTVGRLFFAVAVVISLVVGLIAGSVWSSFSGSANTHIITETNTSLSTLFSTISEVYVSTVYSSTGQPSVTVTQLFAGQVNTYSFSIWASNPKSTVSNISMVSSNAALTQVIQFNVSILSSLFVGPSFQIIPSNCSTFYLNYSNGTIIPTEVNQPENVLITKSEVLGLIQMNYAPCAIYYR